MSQQCFCRNWAVEKTSWTDANPGQRFLTCSNWQLQLSFDGPEAEFDDRSKGVINRIKRHIGKKYDDHIMELVNARKEYNEQVKQLKNKVWMWKCFAVLLLLYVFSWLV
ncbi:GRF-type domain-containing protein [Heracleum sosnowskyi]|uniref:GRF-type domain-containing protein n=1 Tax=Heracleum sosnowskyi TaxID=360622 RepID=A0AAD8HKN8_9APIA|nr:GRF-type domain-containing protein [Heracleum sosnowskyi]